MMSFRGETCLKIRCFILWAVHRIKLALERCEHCGMFGIESTLHGVRVCHDCGLDIERKIAAGIYKNPKVPTVDCGTF